MTRTANETFDHHRGARPLLRPTSRLRISMFLLVNLAGFAVVNAFWLYLTTGQWVRFSLGSYRKAIVTPLGELLVEPLSVLTHPWMVLVTGLLLALVILVPLVVAVLYRLVFAAAFVAMVALVGHAPVLALALAVGCMVAARTPLRSDMPFLAVLIGLAPVAAYLYFFAFQVGGTPAALPLQKWVFYAPFILAGLTAAVGSAVVLFLARLTGFRPGAVWPVLAVLLAAPLGVFYTHIGAEELEYQLLVADLSGGAGIFHDVDLERWKRRHGVGHLSREALWVHLTGKDNDDGDAGWVGRRRRQLQIECERFLRDYPDGQRTAEVLWLRGQAMSIEVRRAAFDHGLVKYSAGYCHAPSAAAWRELETRRPSAPQAALARWKLARLALRRGTSESVEEAHDLLTGARARLREHLATEPAAPARVFLPPESRPTRQHYDEALVNVEKLLWMLRRNALRGEPEETFGQREALRAWLDKNPNAAGYLGKLENIWSTTASGTRLEDNLKLAIARRTDDLVVKAERLLEVEALGATPNRHHGAAFGTADAALPAKYYLGLIAMRPADVRKLHELWHKRDAPYALRDAQAYFDEVIAADEQPWKRLAERCLALSAGAADRRSRRDQDQ
ncbi:MAG: hypothetical protein KGY99_08320 [Phycisphaerae bacterium]|nr:hypothetical protein [Phycisphaerae bacterium]